MNKSSELPGKHLDRYDQRILEILQEDATVPIAEIAERVGLTSTPCWKRIQKLEERGFIRKRVALLDPQKLNVGITVFISIRTNQHGIDWYDAFHKLVSAIPEVTEFYRTAGNTDYLLKVLVPSIEGYDQVYKKLIKGVKLADVSSMFAMEQIKYTTSLPLSHG